MASGRSVASSSSLEKGTEKQAKKRGEKKANFRAFSALFETRPIASFRIPHWLFVSYGGLVSRTDYSDRARVNCETSSA